MSNTSVRKALQVICILTSSLSANLALADWSGNPSQTRYNNQFGDFPPDDIDQHIQSGLDQYGVPSESTSAGSTDETSSTPELDPSQNYQQPYYGNYDQRGGYYPQAGNSQAGNYRNNSGNNFSGPFNGPWGNNSGFNGPWNTQPGNSGANFSGPWNNNGSNFSMPWGNNMGNNMGNSMGNNRGNNNGSGFSMPWGNNSNGSNFSMPWGNSR